MKKSILYAGVLLFSAFATIKTNAQAPTATTNPNQPDLLEKVTAAPGEVNLTRQESHNKWLVIVRT